MSEPRLLGIFAHPNDEGVMGAAFLQYADADVDTGLICATRGEAGEIADPTLATAENLGEVRVAELGCAAEVPAIDDLWLLPFREPGMAGTPENGDPRAFVQADPTLVMRDLVSIIRDFRPDVVVTFDPSGAYGHPDHISICRYTRMAFEAAADAAQFPDRGEPHAVSKLYYTSFPRSVIQRLAEWMRSQNYQGPFSALDPDTLGVPDELIDVRLEAEPWQEAKDEAWAMHRTQQNSASVMAQVPEEIRRQWRAQECYQLAATRVGPDLPGENDLFARVLVD